MASKDYGNKIIKRTLTDKLAFWVMFVGGGAVGMIHAYIAGEYQLDLGLAFMLFWALVARMNEWKASVRQVNRITLQTKSKWTISYGDAPAGTIQIGSEVYDGKTLEEGEYFSIVADEDEPTNDEDFAKYFMQ